MATRPVYMSCSTHPYRETWNVEFVYNRGLATSQKRKNITAIHNAFHETFPALKVLEISSKSMQEGGKALSAFHLLKYVPSLGKSVPVENIYQAGKVFRNGGPFTDLLHGSPRDAKRDERLRTSGPLTAFHFEGAYFPIHPQSAFYDFIYISALRENKALADVILQYDAFTDVEFSPKTGLNCQAGSAALFASLCRQNLMDTVTDFASFLTVLGE